MEDDDDDDVFLEDVSLKRFYQSFLVIERIIRNFDRIFLRKQYD